MNLLYYVHWTDKRKYLRIIWWFNSAWSLSSSSSDDDGSVSDPDSNASLVESASAKSPSKNSSTVSDFQFT